MSHACTCKGTCRGAASLGANWHCAMSDGINELPSKTWTMNGAGEVVEVLTLPNLTLAERIYPVRGRGPREPWESDIVGAQNSTLEAPDQVAYDERMGLHSKKYLTVIRPSDARWMLERLVPRITGKVVVEIGAGIGVLACAMATHAKRVYAIEADPMWGWAFARHLYKHKPTNLTYILDVAENLTTDIVGEVAVVVTGSDEENLRRLANKFAPEVIMPWQDWKGGVAVAQWAATVHG